MITTRSRVKKYNQYIRYSLQLGKVSCSSFWVMLDDVLLIFLQLFLELDNLDRQVLAMMNSQILQPERHDKHDFEYTAALKLSWNAVKENLLQGMTICSEHPSKEQSVEDCV